MSHVAQAVGVSLPDLWAPGVRVVFVGINPSSYSVAQGHYFARKQNRFWPAFSRSRLSAAMRESLGVAELTCQHDVLLPSFGFGLTDLIKRDTPGIAGLKPEDYRESAPVLKGRLARWGPKVACFHGMMGFRPFVRYGLGQSDEGLELGPQTLKLGDIALYCLANPSPANARYRLEDLVAGYDGLADWLQRTKRPKVGTVTSDPISYDPTVFDPLTDSELEEWGL